MMYVPHIFRVTNNQLNDRIMQLGNQDPDVDILLMIDFAFHHQDDDYDGGLSFIDRIHAKLGRFHPEWNVQNMKHTIRNANNPIEEYLFVIDTMLENVDGRLYYGL